MKGYHNEQQPFKISMRRLSIYFSKLKLQCKRPALKLYLVLFKLTWPEQGVNVSTQAIYLQKAHNALQYNTPDQQAAASYFGALPWLLRAPRIPQFTQSCATSAVTAKGSGSFASHALVKIKTRNSKGSGTLRSGHAQEI